ncbi:MAG: ECF RNA polymerase sigma-E factor [Candidatus Moanabacter tarae]|uniref:ECF RNA polymerase sigma-E factor n=1 Tax=Candidatus Moanibacter tarae TaxID=2200854 RepID=A0A2Z4ALR5_9BACT|nr:MAG: ECF RNA polymerase sigma-E factor [Candidatus Moanabacter tarae]|tara:strand:- start:12810 stop:13442 length:633 start_codon:yes stop_codon:yes gene_type:complete
MHSSVAVEKSLTQRSFGSAEQTDDDLAYVRRVQSGDVEAFDHLVLKYRERLFSIIYNLTSNREDAADLTQESFIKAFRSLKRFRGRSSFFTWLYRIAINTTLTNLRKNRMRHFFSFEKISEEVSSAEIIEALVTRTNSDRSVLLGELQEKLNEALHKLSPKHRAVVVLFEIEGLSHQQISEVMNCSIGTVRSRLHYAKQQLQAYLQAYID